MAGLSGTSKAARPRSALVALLVVAGFAIALVVVAVVLARSRAETTLALANAYDALPTDTQVHEVFPASTQTVDRSGASADDLDYVGPLENCYETDVPPTFEGLMGGARLDADDESYVGAGLALLVFDTADNAKAYADVESTNLKRRSDCTAGDDESVEIADASGGVAVVTKNSDRSDLAYIIRTGNAVFKGGYTETDGQLDEGLVGRVDELLTSSIANAAG